MDRKNRVKEALQIAQQIEYLTQTIKPVKDEKHNGIKFKKTSD